MSYRPEDFGKRACLIKENNKNSARALSITHTHLLNRANTIGKEFLSNCSSKINLSNRTDGTGFFKS